MTIFESKGSFIESVQQGLRSSPRSQIAVDYENALKLVSGGVITRSSGFVRDRQYRRHVAKLREVAHETSKDAAEDGRQES